MQYTHKETGSCCRSNSSLNNKPIIITFLAMESIAALYHYNNPPPENVHHLLHFYEKIAEIAPARRVATQCCLLNKKAAMSAFLLSKQHWVAPWSVRTNNGPPIPRTLHGASLHPGRIRHKPRCRWRTYGGEFRQQGNSTKPPALGPGSEPGDRRAGGIFSADYRSVRRPDAFRGVCGFPGGIRASLPRAAQRHA